MENVYNIQWIQIGNHRDLTSFKGLDNLLFVDTDLRLLGSFNFMTSINSFDRLKTVGGQIIISEVFGINNLVGFENLETAGSLKIILYQLRRSLLSAN